MGSSLAKFSLLLIWLFELLYLAMCAQNSNLTIPHCTRDSDCGAGYCCRIGMSRFSIPTCEKQRSLGDICLMGAQPEDKVLSYPYGVYVKVFGIHRLFCPCEEGLSCLDATCKPSESSTLTRNQFYTIDDFDYTSLDTRKKKDNFAEFDN